MAKPSSDSSRDEPLLNGTEAQASEPTTPVDASAKAGQPLAPRPPSEDCGANDGSCGAAGESSAALCRQNIHMMFAFQLLGSVAWSTALGPVFDKYLYYLGGGAARGPQLLPEDARNSLVGMAASISGLSSLLLAVPVGWLVDRCPERRARLLRGCFVLGATAALTLIAATLMDYTLLIYLGLFLLGAFFELANSASEAIFADSAPQGKRSGLYTTKAVLSTLGAACGPAISVVMLSIAGNQWQPNHMKLVIIAGTLLMPLSCITLFFFQDPPGAARRGAAGGQPAGSSQAGSSPEAAEASRPSRRCGPFQPWHVPFLLAFSDFITAVGAGMTVKFFNLFFTEDHNFAPVQICLLQTAYPLVITIFMGFTQKLSKPLGRSQATLLFFSLNVVCLRLLAEVNALSALLVLYLVRGGFANSAYPVDRSILMDFTPSSQRGRWNAVQSLTSMTWSGSAFIGGLLSDSHDYKYTFVITATVYAAACVVKCPLLCLVPRRENAVAAAASDAACQPAARDVPVLPSSSETGDASAAASA